MSNLIGCGMIFVGGGLTFAMLVALLSWKIALIILGMTLGIVLIGLGLFVLGEA